MGLGMSDSEFFIIVLAALLPILLVTSVIVLAILYFIRRPEVGPELARHEIKRAAILMSILIPLAFILAFLFFSLFITYSDRDTAETLIFSLVAIIILVLIGYPMYWWRKLGAAKKSELFQVPIKASWLILFVGIAWVFLGIIRFILFFVGDNPLELILGFSQIILGLYFAAMWFRPTWHITEKGIFTTLGAVTWGSIIDQEWRPKNENEVLLSCTIKRWWLPFKMPMTQAIPIEYERPLKATINKYTEKVAKSSIDLILMNQKDDLARDDNI